MGSNRRAGKHRLSSIERAYGSRLLQNLLHDQPSDLGADVVYATQDEIPQVPQIPQQVARGYYLSDSYVND